MEQIFTIGYGGLTSDEFIRLLMNQNIQILVDVRSQPYSKHNPDFRKKNLQQELTNNKIEYIYLGNLIGGRPQDTELYDSEGHLDYKLYEKSDDYSNGIKTLVKYILDEKRLCIMCAESDPSRCHRSHLIAESLSRMQIEVVHILNDGKLTDHADLRKTFTDRQINLFE